MKLKKKQLSTAIAIALTLLLATPFITSTQSTFGQVAPIITIEPNLWVGPRPSGINQNVLIQGELTPRPIGYSQDPALSKGNVYKNLTFMITRPDGSKENMTIDTNNRSEALFWYNCTQLGTYSVRLYWAGDEQHYAVTTSAVNWLVRQEQAAALEKLDMFAYVSVTNPVIGLGQTQNVIGWLAPPREISGGIYYNLKFTITKPSGTVITKVKDTDTPATVYIPTVCDEVGTWSAKFSYDGDLLHKDVVSATVTWTVQDAQVSPQPQQPVPNYPWKFPVSPEYQEWYQITGPWKGPSAGSILDTQYSSFNPYTTAPNTPHVLWKLDLVKSGTVGGELGYFDWHERRPDQFEPYGLNNFVAVQGRLYYNRPERYTLDGTDRGTHPVLYCVDQYTGKLIWRRDLPGTGNGGPAALVIDQTYKADPSLAMTEASMFNIVLTSGGVWAVEPMTGDTVYFNQSLSGTLYQDAVYMNNYPKAGNFTKWDAFTKSIVWTTQAPYDNKTLGYSFPSIYGEGFAIAFNQGLTDSNSLPMMRTWDLKSGELILNTAVSGLVYGSTGGYIIQDKKTFYVGSDMRTRAIDITTGKLVWTSDPADYPWGSFGTYYQAYSWGPTGGGKDQIYVPNYDGYIYCYDTLTGKLNWRVFTINSTEVGMGHQGPWAAMVIADNKLYHSCGEHTSTQPVPRGGQLYCDNAVTGERVWTLDGFYGRTGDRQTANVAGASAGMLWYYNGYDGCLYMFGKGQTATTVSVSQNPIANGASTVIQGTVTDQSPGAKDTPAVSDNSQSDWVPYLYMNKPMPTNATGVSVFLQAMRSDGTVVDISHVTTDVMGHYEYTWTPPDQDTYKILATFEGSESYYSSSTQTALSVGAALPTPALQAAADNTPMFIASTAAIIIAIAIVGLMMVRMLRKRP